MEKGKIDYQVPVTRLKRLKGNGDMQPKGNGDIHSKGNGDMQGEMEICKQA